MAHSIFISYRREDSGWSTQALHTALSGHFGEDQVFMDLDDIHGGDDFAEVIKSALSQCDVLIAVIGPQWLNASKGGVRRLDHPNDYVVLEIGTALERGIRVIPVLIDRTPFPATEDLPERLKLLRRRNAISLERESFTADVAKIMNILERQDGLERDSSPPREDDSKTQVKVAWIGAIAAVVAAIIGGLFMLQSDSGSDIHIDNVQTQDGGIMTIGGQVTINQSDPSVMKAIEALSAQLRARDIEPQQQEQIISQQATAVKALAQQRKLSDSPVDIEEALEKLGEGDSEAAEAIFQKIAQDKTQNVETRVEAYLHIGALAFLNDKDKALIAYRRATALDPENLTAWSQLGDLERRDGDFQAAEEAYRVLLRLAKANGDEVSLAIAYRELGLVYGMQRDLEQSEAMYRKMLALETKLGRKEKVATAYLNLGVIYRFQGDPKRAEKSLKDSINLLHEIGETESAEKVQSLLDSWD